MKAMMLTGLKKMELFNVPKPQIINSNDVLIKVTTVGVCGSDIHYYDRGAIGSQIVDYPFTVGHETAGIVEAIGDNVKSVKIGDKIAIEPAITCGVCDQCLAGRPHTCRNNRFLGCPGQVEGSLMEYLVMPECNCIKLYGNLKLDDGVLSEPLSIGLYAVKQADIKPNDVIGITGFGPIGMSVMLAAKSKNVMQIYVTEKIEGRIKLAKKECAIWVGNPDTEDVVAEINKYKTAQLDIVFECSGTQEALDNAIEVLKPGGKLVIIGIPEGVRWSFSSDLGRRKEITIINIRRQNNCVEEVLELIEKGKIDASNMVSHRFNFKDVSDAFEMVSKYEDGVMKVMIDF